MAEPAPVSARPLVRADAEPIPWSHARTVLAQASWYWLATAGPDAPHVRPVLAVWVDGALRTTSSPNARKGRNLSTQPRCTAAAATDELHVVLEGTAVRVTDGAQLRRTAEAYASKYQWPVEVRDGAFHADGAPTAGPPPYHVFEIVPTVVYGFGWTDHLGPRSTRWRFRDRRRGTS